MAAGYPLTDVREHGLLDVGDGNQVYWEAYGNPAGKPAVGLHGGPGSGIGPWWGRYFDPQAYRIVLFDQRGCGRSIPNAGDPSVSLAANTTQHQISDIELLRQHLGIERWLVFGFSWGSVLGLAYAHAHPDRVTELILGGVATGRVAEVELLTRGLGRFFPAAFERFLDLVPPAERDGSLPAAYARLLADPDPAVRARAARGWCDWENAIEPTAPPQQRFEDPAFRYAFSRMVTHYWASDHFLEDGILLREAARLAGIPGVLVQGSLDLGNLLGTVWQLAHSWPGSELIVLDDLGHGGGAEMVRAITAATDQFR